VTRALAPSDDRTDQLVEPDSDDTNQNGLELDGNDDDAGELDRDDDDAGETEAELGKDFGSADFTTCGPVVEIAPAAPALGAAPPFLAAAENAGDNQENGSVGLSGGANLANGGGSDGSGAGSNQSSEERNQRVPGNDRDQNAGDQRNGSSYGDQETENDVGKPYATVRAALIAKGYQVTKTFDRYIFAR
jgi:hypothetical protein